MEPVRIEVMQEDIDKGERTACEFCPVARAVCRALGERLGYAKVDGFSIDLGVWPEEEYRTPAVVNAFIERFDAGEPVEPFSFLLGDGA